MSWETIFNLANGWALLAWLVLLLAARGGLSGAFVMYAGVGLLCAAYAAGLALVLARGGGAEADFSTIAGVRAIFASDAGATIGWLHYLAFDLFTGIWISQDGDRKGFARMVQAPVLVLTFLAGPVGLLIWLAIRESRARAAARAASGGVRK